MATSLIAQPPPLGGEFQVNSTTVGQQGRGDVASFPDGSFVVVWSDGWAAAGETSIRGQRYASDGGPLGGEFVVSTYTSYDATLPRVAASATGAFVAVWETLQNPEENGSGIAARRFAADGSPLGDEFLANSWTPGRQQAPDVATGADGSFVVTWHSEGGFGSDVDGRSIQSQRFAADGSPLGGQVQVNVVATSEQRLPSVEVLPDGGHVVVWYSTDPGSSIRGRLFDLGGSAGSEFQISVEPVGYSAPSIATGESGFLVAWEAYTGIASRLLSNLGTPLGDEIPVDTWDGSAARPDVAAAPAGEFLVTWDSVGSPGDDDSGTSIQARWSDSAGVPAGPQFQVNAFTSGFQQLPRASMGSDRTLVVTWAGLGGGGDPDNAQLARRYRVPPIFADGFESGDTSAWSSTVP